MDLWKDNLMDKGEGLFLATRFSQKKISKSLAPAFSFENLIFSKVHKSSYRLLFAYGTGGKNRPERV